jgi:hypothetical protein
VSAGAEKGTSDGRLKGYQLDASVADTLRISRKAVRRYLARETSKDTKTPTGLTADE